MRTLNVREDFRRDGLAANFLSGSETIASLAEAVPGSVINIGYPCVCTAEYEACRRILTENKNSQAELAVVGHATRAHVDALISLTSVTSGEPRTSANIWIPTSNRFIAQTFRTQPESVLSRAVELTKYWTQHSDRPLDIAFADATSPFDTDVDRLNTWSESLLDAGVRRIILCDSRGDTEPDHLENTLSKLTTPIERLELHPHNDSNHGLDNAKLAKEYGMGMVGTAAFGAGERLSMLDPRSLIPLGVEMDEDAFERFVNLYRSDNPNHKQVLETIYGRHTVVTGTQYRLRQRDTALRPLFGVTSDRYITSAISGLPQEMIPTSVLDEIKAEELYHKRKHWLEPDELKDALEKRL